MDKTKMIFLYKHFSPLVFTLRKGHDQKIIIVSAFIISVSDLWFLLTAGHCFSSIKDLKNDGYKIIASQIIDYVGIDAVFHSPVPFDYNEDKYINFREIYGVSYDYGIYPLSQYYREILESNKLQPLNEETWQKQPDDFDEYWLLGIPEERINREPHRTSFETTPIQVERLEKKPDYFSDADADLFYGKLLIDDDLQSIEGMSGGPLFGFIKSDNGDERYWLLALQSQWRYYTQEISACPTNFVGGFLKYALEQQKHLDQTP